MNTPNPETVRKAQTQRLIREAQNRGIRVTVKVETTDNTIPVNAAFVLAGRGWDGKK